MGGTSGEERSCLFLAVLLTHEMTFVRQVIWTSIFQPCCLALNISLGQNILALVNHFVYLYYGKKNGCHSRHLNSALQRRKWGWFHPTTSDQGRRWSFLFSSCCFLISHQALLENAKERERTSWCIIGLRQMLVLGHCIQHWIPGWHIIGWDFASNFILEQDSD